MLRLLSAAELGEIDRRAATQFGIPPATLMENAGRAVLAAMADFLAGLAEHSFVVVCGRGNNGGDGFVVARLLHEAGLAVRCLLLWSADELRDDARVKYSQLVASGCRIEQYVPGMIIDACRQSGAVIVDALFGTGLKRPPAGKAAEAIEEMSTSTALVVAVDVPSGVDADTGAAPGPAVRAALTVTMGAQKPGLVLYPGRAHAGRVIVADIGFPPELLQGGDKFLLDGAAVRTMLPARRPDGHKGSFGTVAVIAGSAGFSGAAILATAAAVRSGCGLVRVACPRLIEPVIAAAVPEAVKVPLGDSNADCLGPESGPTLRKLLETADAVAIGPGLGTADRTSQLLIELAPAVRCPTVLDADGLNIAAAHPEVLSRFSAPLVLTPHPGEFGRLTSMSAQEVNSDRIGHSRAWAKEHSATLVLKGASTVIADPAGRVLVNPNGNSGLGTGGSGDILTGLIAGLLAQGASPPNAAAAAVFLHGLAADIAVPEMTEYCLGAGDLLRYLPAAFRSVLTSN